LQKKWRGWQQRKNEVDSSPLTDDISIGNNYHKNPPFEALTVFYFMAFKLCQCAQKRWIRLHRPERLADVVKGVKFVNGIEEKRIAA
jgi:hypothetical protein